MMKSELIDLLSDLLFVLPPLLYYSIRIVYKA